MSQLVEYTNEMNALRAQVTQLANALEKAQKSVVDMGVAGQKSAKGFEAALKSAASTIAQTAQAAESFESRTFAGATIPGVTRKGIAGNLPMPGSATVDAMRARLSEIKRMAHEERMALEAMGMGAHGPFSWERQRIMAAQLGKENAAAARPRVLMGLGDEETTKNIEKQAEAIKKVKQAGQFAGEPLGVAALGAKKLGNEMQRTRILTFQLTSGLQDIAVVLQGGGGIGAAARAASNNLGLLFSTMSTGWAIAGTAFVIGAASLLDYIGKKWPDATERAREEFRKLREEWERATSAARDLFDAQQNLAKSIEGARQAGLTPVKAERERAATEARAFTAKTLLAPDFAEGRLTQLLTQEVQKRPGGSVALEQEVKSFTLRRKELENKVRRAEEAVAKSAFGGTLDEIVKARYALSGWFGGGGARAELAQFEKEQAPQQRGKRDELDRTRLKEQSEVQRLMEAARRGDLTELPENIRKHLAEYFDKQTRMRLGAQASMAMMGLGQAIGTGMGGSASFDRRQLELQREIFEMERPYKTSGRGMPFRVRREIEGKRAELEDLGLREREAREREREARQGRVEDLTMASKEALEEILKAITKDGILVKEKQPDKPDDQPEPGWHKRQQEGARNPVVMNPAGR